MKIYIDTQNTIRYYNEKDQLHRTDGPAVERANGEKEWWINGQRHRTDGPAIEWASGNKYWCINGLSFTEEQFKRRVTRLGRILYL